MKRKWVRIRTRWLQAKASERLFWRAVIYGITSATFAGAFIGFASEIEYYGFNGFGGWAAAYALIGMMYGLIAGPTFGVAMKFIAKVFYPRHDSPVRFRIAMGGLTLIGVGVTAPPFSVYLALNDLLRGAPEFPIGATAIILMWGFGVYLSQVLAKKYISEVSPRKRKGKPGWRGLLSAAGDSVEGG